MFGYKPTPTSSPIVGAAARSIDQALNTTRQAGNGALDSLGNAAHQLRDDTVPVIDRISDQAHALARQGMGAVRDQSLHLQARARRTSDDTLHYIRDEPVKAVLIAAATGAVLIALAGLLMRPPRDR